MVNVGPAGGHVAEWPDASPNRVGDHPHGGEGEEEAH